MRHKKLGNIIMGVCLMAIAGSAGAQTAFDHQYLSWQGVLSAYTRQGKVRYEALKANDQGFKKAVAEIVNISKSEYDTFEIKQKEAFWINAYNIGAMKHILDNYPIRRSLRLSALRYPANSIQQIPDVWDKPVLNLLGQEVSLNDIENKVLRPEFKDPRVHFAIVCASISCPVIRSEAYTADKLDQQFLEQIEIFLDDPAKVRYDMNKDILYVSPIFKWFKEDFDQEGGTMALIKKYSADHMFDTVTRQTQIQWLGYDWNLNDDTE